MKKKISILGIICIVILLAIFTFIAINFKLFRNTSDNDEEIISDITDIVETETENSDNSTFTMKAVIVEVYEDKKQLLAINSKKTDEFFFVNYRNEDNIEFKANQEIEILYDGTISTTYPKKLNNVEKIEIIKENSNIIIPNNVLRYCYSSEDNVNIKIDKFNASEIIFTVTDKNEFPYEYSIDYTIYQETKNTDYTGKGKMTEATSTSTSSYTGTGFEYVYKEITEASDAEKNDTIERKIIESEIFNQKIKINFEDLYDLSNGKYYLIITNSNFNFRIDFSITDDKLEYNEPYINS